MATIIRVDGTKEEITDISADNLREIVGGWIEIVYLPSGCGAMIVDEEGKFKNKPKNDLATIHGTMAGIADDDFIVGDAVILSPEELESW